MAPSRALESGSSDATTHSAHVADPALRPFLAPTFDPIEYLNDSLPALSLSPSAPATATTLTLPELSTQTQTVLSQLSAHTSRLSGTLTQLTDEILRSGSRLAYEVEVLRGETLGLSEALTEGLSEDVALFVPDGLTVAAGDKQHEGGAADLPPYVTQLRTLSLVKDRLDTVIQIFGDAMEWTIPPSEVSITSSFISVSAPEPGSESHSREEKGHEVAKRLRDQVKELLASGADGDDGLEAAVARVEELRELAKVWKGTAEEKSRVKFVESLIRLVEERQAVLEQEANEQASRPSPKKPSPRKSSSGAAGFSDETGEQSRFGWPVRQGGYGFIDQLQKMRGGFGNVKAGTTEQERLLPCRLHLSVHPRLSIVDRIFLEVPLVMSHYDPFEARPPKPSRLGLLGHFVIRMTRLRCGWAGLLILAASLAVVAFTWKGMVTLPYTVQLSGGIFDTTFADRRPHEAHDSSTAFHLLVPASHSNANLCKTLLSAMILDYPPPTIINFNKTFEGDSWDKGTHTGKVRGVLDFLTDNAQIGQEDMVLVIDGYDVWFQLPPEVLLERYHALTRRANDRLGLVHGTSNDAGRRFSQSVVFGADKLCWPNDYADPACYAVPESPLPRTAWGKTTDKDPGGWHNRPRFLNSGNIIGRAEDVRAAYEAAAFKVEEQERGQLGDQFVFAEIFGEQEYQRREVRTPAKLDRWKQWLGGLGSERSSNRPDIVPNNMTAIPGRRYEYGIGLDYEMALFQTMTHAHEDIEYVQHNATHPLPADIVAHPPPLALGNTTAWTSLPLATNTHVPSVPALLHFNGDKSFLDSWWPRMWFQPTSRALLNRTIHDPRLPHPTWDGRGGRGGAWTADGLWLGWSALCGGSEEDVFADGKGRWGWEGKAESGGKIYDAWGKVIEDPELGV